jgi:preprotein translocase subunit SecA
MRRFGGDRIKWIMEKAGLDDDVPIENKMISKAVESAQSKVEGYHFEIRKNLVDYDDVVNTQRDVIYKLRQKVLAEEALRDEITEMTDKQIRAAVGTYLTGPDDSWDVEGLQREIKTIFPFLPEELEDPDEVYSMDSSEIEEILIDEIQTVHDQRIEEFGADGMSMIERYVLLRQIDSHWVEHLTAMENMRQGIGLQAVGQRDPLVQYKRVSFEMFEELMGDIEVDVAHQVYRLAPAPENQTSTTQNQSVSAGRGAETTTSNDGESADSVTSNGRAQASIARGGAGQSKLAAVAERHGAGANVAKKQKIGRNDPCHCGSGKKFKRCHG